MNSYNNEFSGIELTEFDQIISKIQFYNMSELGNNIKMEEEFSDILLDYDSDNRTKLESIYDSIIKKQSVIRKRHDNNLTVLLKTKDNTISTAEENSKMFDNMG